MSRKKIIKLTAGIFAAVSVMMTFTGCNSKTESSIAEEIQVLIIGDGIISGAIPITI